MRPESLIYTSKWPKRDKEHPRTYYPESTSWWCKQGNNSHGSIRKPNLTYFPVFIGGKFCSSWCEKCCVCVHRRGKFYLTCALCYLIKTCTTKTCFKIKVNTISVDFLIYTLWTSTSRFVTEWIKTQQSLPDPFSFWAAERLLNLKTKYQDQETRHSKMLSHTPLMMQWVALNFLLTT